MTTELRREWVEDGLKKAGLDYGKYPEGTYGRARAQKLLDGWACILDILDEEELEERVLLMRHTEGFLL